MQTKEIKNANRLFVKKKKVQLFASNLASQVAQWVKNAPAGNTGDMGSIPGSGRSSGVGNGNPLQYFCLENPIDRGAWWATVHGVTESWTQLKQLSMQTPEVSDNNVMGTKEEIKWGFSTWSPTGKGPHPPLLVINSSTYISNLVEQWD